MEHSSSTALARSTYRPFAGDDNSPVTYLGKRPGTDSFTRDDLLGHINLILDTGGACLFSTTFETLADERKLSEEERVRLTVQLLMNNEWFCNTVFFPPPPGNNADPNQGTVSGERYQVAAFRNSVVVDNTDTNRPHQTAFKRWYQ